MVLFLLTCIMVLLNILIAQLSDTYQNIQGNAQRGLALNRAWIISRVELNSVLTGKVKGHLIIDLKGFTKVLRGFYKKKFSLLRGVTLSILKKNLNKSALNGLKF